MKLTCAQMDVLISFYIDNELSKALKSQVEDHLKSCTTCRAKYDIIKSMLADLKTSLKDEELTNSKEVDSNMGNSATSRQYRLFKTNL